MVNDVISFTYNNLCYIRDKLDTNAPNYIVLDTYTHKFSIQVITPYYITYNECYNLLSFVLSDKIKTNFNLTIINIQKRYNQIIYYYVIHMNKNDALKFKLMVS